MSADVSAAQSFTESVSGKRSDGSVMDIAEEAPDSGYLADVDRDAGRAGVDVHANPLRRLSSFRKEASECDSKKRVLRRIMPR